MKITRILRKKPWKKPFLWLQGDPCENRPTRRVNSRLCTQCLFFISNKESVLSDEGDWADFYPTTSDLPISLAHPELPEGNVEKPAKGIKHKSSKQCLFLSQLSRAFFPHCSLPPPSSPPSPIALQFILFLQKHAPYGVHACVELQWATRLSDRHSLSLLHPACSPGLLQHVLPGRAVQHHLHPVKRLACVWVL